MIIDILKFEPTIGNKNNTIYNENNHNHMIVELGEESLHSNFASYNSFHDKVKKMSGEVSLFLYCNFTYISESEKTKSIEQVKYIISNLAANNIESLNIIIVAVDYDAAYSQIYDICYSDPVIYNSRTPNVLIWKSIIRKLIGHDYAKKINSIRTFIGRH